MKKKLVVLLSIVLVICSLLCACGGNSEYVEVDGERYDIKEFYDMLISNDLKQEQFDGKSVTIVGCANDIQGPHKVDGVKWNTSCGIVGGHYTAIMIDDGYDDVLSNLPQENLVKIQGTLSVDFITIYINNATVEVLK